MAGDDSNEPRTPSSSWAQEDGSCNNHGVTERTQTPEVHPNGGAADPAGTDPSGAAAVDITERPEVKELLAEMKSDLKPGEDPLYYDWTNDRDPEGGDKAYVSAAKPARARHITIDAQKVKIAKEARNPARLAKTERIRKGQPVPGAIPGVEGPLAAAPAAAVAGLTPAGSEPPVGAVGSEPPAAGAGSEPPAAAAGSEPPAAAAGSEPPAASVGSDPPVAAAVGSDPPASSSSSPWGAEGAEVADEVSQDDLPSSLLLKTSAEPSTPSGPAPARAEATGDRRGRGLVVVVALLAVAGVVLLWWLASGGAGESSAEPQTITEPGEPDREQAREDTAAAEAVSAEPDVATGSPPDEAGQGGGASAEEPMPGTDETVTPPRPRSTAPTTRPKPVPSASKDKPELVEH